MPVHAGTQGDIDSVVQSGDFGPDCLGPPLREMNLVERSMVKWARLN